MRILLTGANGFIGRHLTAAFVASGHEVVAAVRRVGEMQRRFPSVTVLHVDLNRDTTAATWAPRLPGVDAIVNCAGILQQRRGQSIDAVHFDGPKALFDACVQCGVRRVVQISAVSADDAAGTPYARTKKQADDYLTSLDLDWVILRPSLVHAEGSHGGTSLLRGLAAFPFVIPLVGRGAQKFQPIHMDDLTSAVVRVLEDRAISRVTLSPVGPETLTVRDILILLRAWLGLAPAPTVSMPLAAVRVMARLGDWFGAGPVNSTALRQLEYGNVARPEPFTEATGIKPRSMATALAERPSHVQDRWHARLYFVRPLLRWSLGLMWVVLGVFGLVSPFTTVVPYAVYLGVPDGLIVQFAVGISCVEIVIGVGVLLLARPRIIAGVQLERFPITRGHSRQ